MLLSLDIVKAHLQIEGIGLDDEYIKMLITTCTSILEENIRASYLELNARELNIFKQALLLLIGDYYKNREDTTDLAVNKISHGVERLCNLIRRYNR